MSLVEVEEDLVFQDLMAWLAGALRRLIQLKRWQGLDAQLLGRRGAGSPWWGQGLSPTETR